jgi:hypothetical protein
MNAPGFAPALLFDASRLLVSLPFCFYQIQRAKRVSDFPGTRPPGTWHRILVAACSNSTQGDGEPGHC